MASKKRTKSSSALLETFLGRRSLAGATTARQVELVDDAGQKLFLVDEALALALQLQIAILERRLQHQTTISSRPKRQGPQPIKCSAR